MCIEIKPAKHSAPGQYLGFALQPVRAFYHLLTCPKGAKVSLELLDDVAIHYTDGGLYLEQTKSALRQNPISDWAIDLWKALHNWLAMLEDGRCNASSTSFCIYVTPAKISNIAKKVSDAISDEDIEAVLKMIRAGVAKLKAVPACGDYLKHFLNAPNELQIAIVAQFKLELGDSDPLNAIRSLLRPVIADEHVDMLIKSGIGQAKQALDRLIQRGEAPILDADAFKKDFHAFVRNNNLPGLLYSQGEVPSDARVACFASAGFH